MKTMLLTAAAIAALFTTVAADAQVAKSYFEFKKPGTTQVPGDLSLDTNGQSAPVSGAPGSPLVIGFEGVSQYDGAAFARNFIPPDTNGAVGATQYMETTNGAYAVFDKHTGARQSLVSDVAFWAAAGQTGANGDSRVMYNAAAKKWIAISFGANAKDLQIAVSSTSNALGPWTSTKFEGYGGFGFGATADYPTLAMDSNAVYIGTNNFAPATNGGTNSFRGTTLNVIPLNSLFAGVASTAGIKQFVTPYSASSNTNADRGFAIQGVNSSTVSSSGTVIAASLFDYDSIAYKVNGVSPVTEVGATLGAVTYLGEAAFVTAGAGRQPSAAIAANRRVLAVSDERISSSVYEANGLIYAVHVVNPTGDAAGDFARVHYMVLDSTSFTILDEGDIGEAGYDYWEASIAVNALGQAVIGYNRGGLDQATGKVSFMARSFRTAADGSLVQVGDELLLKESLTDDYHNGSVFGLASVGRQRWGDYSQVSIDPTSSHGFYLIGEFAREYNNAAGGHPGGTGGSRWGTFIANLNVGSVPEPTTWAMLILGFGFVGAQARRQRTGFASA